MVRGDVRSEHASGDRPSVSLAAAFDLVLPVRCAGCPAPAVRPDVPLCAPCARVVLAETARPLGGVLHAPGAAGEIPVVAAAAYGGAVGAVLRSLKDDDRPDTLDLLGAVLAGALDLARELVGPPGGRTAVIPVPASARSRRRRGRAVVPDLARAAVGAVCTRERFVVVDGLRHRGGAADQRELSAEARRVNVAGVLTPTPRLRSVTGGCLLVDDVATTGATLTEGVRALAEGGVDVHGVALLCATP